MTVEYLANEGVLIRSAATAILIDGLMGDGLPDYPILANPIRDSVERALGRFGEIDLVLVTHVHRDHFSPVAVASHLRHNPGAIVVGPAQAADSLTILAGWTDRSRIRTLPSTPGSAARMRLNGGSLWSHGIPHPPSRNQPVEHLVWVVELDGHRVMHLGDSAPSVADLEAAAGDGIDLLLAPFWVLNGIEGRERIAATRASRVAAFHFAKESRPFVGGRGITALQRAGTVIEAPQGPPD